VYAKPKVSPFINKSLEISGYWVKVSSSDIRKDTHLNHIKGNRLSSSSIILSLIKRERAHIFSLY